MDDNQLVVCGGCNAKIGAGNLEPLLQDLPRRESPDLLVGFDGSDDAAVIRLRDDLALIQTVDFFPPMVTDPYVFGQIGAANALSDVYAMGGRVLAALNIVAFPEEQDFGILRDILRGGAEKVQEAGGLLSGGHSIHDRTVKYGLAVTGTVHPNRILRNDACVAGDHLILTKPLGVSILTIGYSAGEISKEGFHQAVESMCTLNAYAMDIIRDASGVHSCTDVTGFGLCGHLHEMLHGACSARIDAAHLPYFEEAYWGAGHFIFTAGGQRNRDFLQDKVVFERNDFALEEIVFDPQTSGGLLVSCDDSQAPLLLARLQAAHIPAADIGVVTEKKEKEIYIV